MSPAPLLLPLLLDPALVLPPCTPDPAAPCWQDSPQATSFTTPSGLRLPPQTADLRLAHDGPDRLLVRIGELPPDTTISLQVGDTYARLGTGLHTLALPTASATTAAARLHLLTPAGPLVWTPAPAPSPTPSVEDTFPLLLADGPPLGMPVTASLDSALHLSAPGADALSLARIQPSWPVPRRGVPEPFSITTDRDRLDLPRPAEGGWYRLTATWAGQDVQAWRLYLPPPRPAGLHSQGLHPAPDALTLQADRPAFHLPDRGAATVTTSEATWGAATVLLAEEVGRLLGHETSVSSRRAGGDLRLERDPTVPAEGFHITVEARCILVRAADLRGAVYGALAVADLLAAGRGQVAAMVITDAPDIAERPLLHQLNLDGRGRLDRETWRAFLRRVVLRGRYNRLYLGLLDSYAFDSLPGAGGEGALSQEDVVAMVGEARALGLEVSPLLSVPGNAAWLTGAEPGLRSGGDPRQLCPRNPAVPSLLAGLYAELWALFGDPTRIHIGHDEVRWDPARTFGDERDPFCAGVPPHVLMAESLRWHVDAARVRGAEAVVWTDALLEAWNGGGPGQTWRALAALSPAEVRLASWGPVGDSVGTLTAQGFRVQRLHTGYYDWKRADYPDVRGSLDGEGLALFYPFPWAAFGGGLAGSRPLPYHWGSVLLAGATAWRAELARTPIADTLHHAAAEALPAYRPGTGGPAGDATPLQVVGRADVRLPEPAGLPAVLEVGGLRFGAPTWVVARPDEAVQLTVGRAVQGVSLLQAVATEVAARQRLQGAYREPLSGPPVVVVRARYADGQEVVGGLRYGLETYEVDGDPRAAVLWGAAGSTAVETGRLWRWDWHNPRPEVPLRSLSVESGAEGALVVVAGAVAW